MRRLPHLAFPLTPLLALALLWSSAAVQAAPFVPANDAQVVETLPTRLGGAAERRAERAQRAALRRSPQSLPLALASARQAIERSRQSGDPRELGLAQAALATWWEQASPPAAVRVLRATIWQRQHLFAPALKDLDAVLADRAAPVGLQAQAELTRAAVLQVTGDWAAARSGYEQLAGPRYAALGAAVQAPAQAGLAELNSLQGQVQPAEKALGQLLKTSGPQQADSAWLWLLRAEMAQRQGEARAGADFEKALSLNDDIYTRAALADWWLDHGQAARAAKLLDGQQAADTLLLRLALAWQALKDPRAAQAISDLGERYAAAALRGDPSHAREQARWALDLMKDPAQALAQAQLNWSHQKEPADAWLLLRCAQAAGQPAAMAPVFEFARAQGWQDPTVQRALRSAGAQP
jgi:hypothetical protein